MAAVLAGMPAAVGLGAETADAAKAPAATRPAATRPAAAAAVSYAGQIRPLLAQRCGSCHGEQRPKAGLSLLTPEGMTGGGKSGAVFVAGKPDESLLVQRLRLPLDERGHMPPANKPQLTEAQIKLITDWVAAGGSFTARGEPAGDAKTAGTRPADAHAAGGHTASNGPKEGSTSAEPEAKEGPVSEPPPADPAALSAMRGALVHVEAIVKGRNRLRVDFAAVARKTRDADAIRLLKPVLPQIESLSLGRCEVGDETARLLAGAPRLRRLDLRATKITDAALAALAGHKALKELVVAQTQLTDAAVDHLLAMPALQRVTVWKSGLSPQALERLRKERPRLHVEGGDKPDARAAEVEPPITLSGDAPKLK
ncbi:MAG: hypothetical protein AMXMBFR83_03840 [Phycisphaerae bacterium]